MKKVWPIIFYVLPLWVMAQPGQDSLKHRPVKHQPSMPETRIRTRDYALPEFPDTVQNLAFESLHFILPGPSRFSTTHARLRFKYLGDSPALITRVRTSDPHFISDYPHEPLVKDKIYEYTISFTFSNYQRLFRKAMAFEINGNKEIAFEVTGNAVEDSVNQCACRWPNPFLYDTAINPALKYAYLNKLTREDFTADEYLPFTLTSLFFVSPTRSNNERMQFALRAFINGYHVADTAVREHLALNFRGLMAQVPGRVARCFLNSTCLGSSDLRLLASMTVDYFNRPGRSANDTIATFFATIEYRSQYESAEIKEVLKQFEEYCRR